VAGGIRVSLVLGDGGIGAGALSSREDGGMGPGFHAFVGSGVVPCDGENRRGNQDRLTSHFREVAWHFKELMEIPWDLMRF